MRMPYYTPAESGASKSPCLYQKKNLYNNNNGGGQCHVIPITKRPIDKVTTRSQAQYQQLIKTMGTEALLDNGKTIDRNNNNNINHNNGNGTYHMHQQPSATTTFDRIAASATNVRKNLSNGTALNLKKDSSLTKTKASEVQSGNKMTKKSNAQASSSNLKHDDDDDEDDDEDCIIIDDDDNETLSSRNLPFSPQKVLEQPAFSIHLTKHEKKEILAHSRIYFIGKVGIKKRTPQTATTTFGADGFESKVYGFDDNNGSYIPVLHDHIAYRYEVLKIIGKGTFGVVLQAYDHKTHRNVALKVIRNQVRFHTQAEEEIKILTKLLENDPDDKFNVVHMHEHFMFRNHPCIVFELLSLNLFELSRKNAFNGFSLSLIRRFTFAIVKCLYALCKYDIIHCDLKPENILLKQQNRSGIKVIDFGSSCFSNKRIHTYIQSRYYRSPEVILCGKYGPPIDMWSLGCILGELFLGRPLLDGENEGDQMACMMELLDVPPKSFLSKCRGSKIELFFGSDCSPNYCTKYYIGQGKRREPGRSPRGKIRGLPGSRELLAGCKDNDFVDFVRNCLIWDPTQRMTPCAALKHPWLSKRSSQIEADNAVYVMNQ